MGVRRPELRLTADPALLLNPASETRVDSFLLSNGLDPSGAYALFVLRPWQGFDRAQPCFAEAADRIYARHGLTPVFLALEPGRDLPVSRETAKLVHAPCHVLSAPHDGSLIAGMMCRMGVVVSMRLHALIFAAGQGIPLVGVVYDPKVSGFLDYLEQKRYLDLNQVTTEGLTDLAEAALLAGADPECAGRLRALAGENEQAAKELLEGEMHHDC